MLQRNRVHVALDIELRHLRHGWSRRPGWRRCL